MSLTYHIPLAMASAKSHWLPQFPSQSGPYAKVISRLKGTMLLTFHSLNSWSLFTFVCEMTSSLVVAVLVESFPIYFHWKILAETHHIVWAPAFIASYQFVLYIPWRVHLCLPNLPLCLLPSPGPSASSFWSISITLCLFPKCLLWGLSIFTPLTKSQNRPEAAPQERGHRPPHRDGVGKWLSLNRNLTLHHPAVLQPGENSC